MSADIFTKEVEQCVYKDRKITACEPLLKTVHGNDHYKKGLSIMPITKFADGKFTHTRDFLVLKQGEYNKRPILCKYCPFCGVVIYKRDEVADAKPKEN